MASQLQAIRYSPGSLEILDQLCLPHQSVYRPVRTAEDGFSAIARMVVRGAPAIAIVAALSLAVELSSSGLLAGEKETPGADEVRALIVQKLEYLVRSRPTAVNLADAARKLKRVVERDAASGAEVAQRYVSAAEQMLADDVRDNTNIGALGAQWILESVGDRGGGSGGGPVSVLTHCNTGSLATAGYGTALGIIRSLHAKSALAHAYCTETRPYNQGARLTAYELVHDKIPATLITDSMAAAVLRSQNVAAVIVGADRVARNGDTANKVGTYQLAIVARHHGAKFVVAAPTTSIDLRTASGDDIVIEERPGREVVVVRGPVADAEGAILEPGNVQTVRIAADGIGVFNPSFDVTPHELVDAIVTEKGVAVKDAQGGFDLGRFFE